MDNDLKAEQWAYIKLRVELEKKPMETKKILKMIQSGRGVSRTLIHLLHGRFEKDSSPYSTKGGGRRTIIDESLMSEVAST